MNVNQDPEKYILDKATGELTIKGGANADGTFGRHDIAKYDCKIEVGKNGEPIREEVIVISVFALPLEGGREPILLGMCMICLLNVYDML